MSDILVPTSPGELVDKLTILRIKKEQISDAGKLEFVQREHDALSAVAAREIPASDVLEKLWAKLYEVNSDLWAIEDDIRAFEARGDFGPGFIALARSVYVTNDERAALKRRINLLLNSPIMEEKSYFSEQDTE